ncbi:hypothetical protein WMY93_005553 [Mugilogobius chulae]|uniref:Partner and localiser of BRCA2 WD40 domain-containing protein n=1 Tax=Mugilogobius chulae TaxID=88201 RepID=A0AAW0PNL9_9GOBI
MEDRLGDLLHCEEQLRNTLHTSDKEKLRQKLALLQKEYLRTVQRLKRAERVESVRRHVRSRITRNHNHDQSKADLKPPAASSAVEHEETKETKSLEQTEQLSPAVASGVVKSPEKRTHTVRFSLASDAAYTPTSDSSQDSAQIPKNSPSLRLRSRRSRLRWAERSSKLEQRNAGNQEAPQNDQEQHCTVSEPAVLCEAKSCFLRNEENLSNSKDASPPNDHYKKSSKLGNVYENRQDAKAEKEEIVNHQLTLLNEASGCEEAKDVSPHIEESEDLYEIGTHQVKDTKAEKEEMTTHRQTLGNEAKWIQFMKKNCQTTMSFIQSQNMFMQMENKVLQNRRPPADWTDLLLPSLPRAMSLPSPLCLPSTSSKTCSAPTSRTSTCPDDQFGSLKLLKLQHIISGVEQLISTSDDTATTDLCVHSPALSSLSPSPTPEMCPQNTHSHERECPQCNVSNQEKQLGCSSPKTLNSVPSPECKNSNNMLSLKYQDSMLRNNSNSHQDQTELESVLKDIVVAQPKLVTNVSSSPEKQKGTDATTPKISVSADTECLNMKCKSLKMDNPAAQSEREDTINCTENIKTHPKTDQLECEETNLLQSPSLSCVSCPLTLPLVGFTPCPPAHSPISECLSPPALSPCISSELCLPPACPSHLPHTCTGPRQTRGGLVDMCCVLSSSGSLSVAVAEKWTVSLWIQQQPSEWSLTHTWSFEEPVLHVFPIPDAPDQFCLTLGQQETQQVRLLSCSTLTQVLLCPRPAHMAIAVHHSRVVCCFDTSASSSLQVFCVSESSPPQPRALMSPGARLSSLASVEGLPHALIGMDQSGCLFIWNMLCGRLLKKLTLGQTFSPSVCLRGFSSQGVLFVLGSLKEPDELSLFTLVAANPRNGKSVLTTGLCPPDQWCGR